jgi:hypothetical protein
MQWTRPIRRRHIRAKDGWRLQRLGYIAHIDRYHGVRDDEAVQMSIISLEWPARRKKWCSPGALTFHNSFEPSIEAWHRNIAWYAELLEYWLNGDHFYSRRSWLAGLRIMLSRRCLRWIYWTITCTVRGPVRSWIQELLSKATTTVHRVQRRAETTLNNSDIIVAMACLSNQGSTQNLMDLESYMQTIFILSASAVKGDKEQVGLQAI